MELHDVIAQFGEFESRDLVFVDWSVCHNGQKFAWVRLQKDSRASQFIDVTGDVNIPSALDAAKEKLAAALARMDMPKVFGRKAPMVMGDIQPYISQIDGSLIESRSKHRAHLKAHNCIEIGNEVQHLKHNKPLESPSGLKEHLIRAVNDSQEKLKRRY